jgi:hypothetical protein
MSGTDTFPEHYKVAFGRNLGLDAAQAMSRIAPLVDADFNYGEAGDSFTSDWLGSSDPVAMTDRFGELPTGQIDSRRRVGHFSSYEDGKVLGSKYDEARQVSDPANKKVIAMKQGLARKQDALVIAGMYGTTYAGRLGVDAVALPSAQKIGVADHTFDALTGDKPLSLSKLQLAMEMFDAAEIEGTRYIALPSRQINHLLTDDSITSADFATVKALVKGEIDEFLRFKFIRYEATPDLGANHRVMAWIDNSIEFRQRMSEPLDVWKRKDKRPHWYGYYQMDQAILRNQDAGVIEIECAKT